MATSKENADPPAGGADCRHPSADSRRLLQPVHVGELPHPRAYCTLPLWHMPSMDITVTRSGSALPSPLGCLWVTDTSSDLRVHTQRIHPFQHGSGRVGLESGERDESAVLTAHGESGFGSDTLWIKAETRTKFFSPCAANFWHVTSQNKRQSVDRSL